MDTKTSAKKQNCKDKLSDASKCLQNYFDVYAGIDAKMAQGKSVLNFDERQHTLSIIASIILVFHFIPLIVYLSRFFDTEEGVKTSLPMLTQLIIASACFVLITLNALLTMRFQDYTQKYAPIVAQFLLLGLCVMTPTDCGHIKNLQMKDSCTLTFKINLVLYIQGSLITVLLLCTTGIHMIMAAVINIVILIQTLRLNTHENTDTESNYEVLIIILVLACFTCTFILLTASRLSWHSNLKKSLVSGSQYQDQAEKMLQIVHSIPCLAGGLILSEHIKVAEVDGGIIEDDNVVDKVTAIDKVFNGERKLAAKRSSTKQKQRRVRVDYATDHIENVLFKGTAGTDLGNKIKKAADLIKSRKSGARGDGSSHNIDLKKVLKKSFLEPLAFGQNQLTQAEKSNVITDLWQVLKKNCSRQASQELVETFYKILPSATQHKTEYREQHKVFKKFDDKTPEQQKAEEKKRQNTNNGGHHGRHGVGSMGNQVLNPDAVKDDGGVVFKNEKAADSDASQRDALLISQERDDIKEEDPDLPPVYLGVTQMKFISEYDGNEYLAVTVRRLLHTDLPGYLTGPAVAQGGINVKNSTAKTFDEYKVKELAAMEYSRVPYFHQKQKLVRDAPVQQPPIKILRMAGPGGLLNGTHFKSDSLDGVDVPNRLSSEGQYDNQVILTEKESSVLKLVTESLKEHSRYFHRVSMTLDEMLFRMNIEQPKVSRNSRQGQFPYHPQEKNPSSSIAKDSNSFFSQTEQSNLREIWNYAKLVLIRVQTLQSCIKIIQMKKAPNFTDGQTRSPDNCIRKQLDLVQTSLHEKLQFNMHRGASAVPKNLIIDWDVYPQIIMSLLVGALDNAQYSEEISIEFKCQESLDDPIEKKPGLASRPARGIKVDNRKVSENNIIKQQTDVNANMTYFSTIIFDNSPGRQKLLDSGRTDPFNESQYNPNVLVAEILATNMGGAVQVEQNEQYRILKVLIPSNGPIHYQQAKNDGTLEENLTQALIKLQFAAFNNFSLPLTRLEKAASDDENDGAYPNLGGASFLGDKDEDSQRKAVIEDSQKRSNKSYNPKPLPGIHKISEKSLGKSVSSRAEKSRIASIKSDPSEQRNRRRRNADEVLDSEYLESNEGGQPQDKGIDKELTGTNNKKVLMKIDPMVSPYVWNELYPDPNEGMSKSPLIAGESSSIDGIDYKSGQMLLPERKDSLKSKPPMKQRIIESQESSLSNEMHSGDFNEFDVGEGMGPLMQFDKAQVPTYWMVNNVSLDKEDDQSNEMLLQPMKQFEVVDTSNRDYQEKQMYNNKKRAMISKFKKILSIGVEGSDDSGSDDSDLNEELRILSAAQMVPEIKPGFDVICNSVDDDRELEILLLDAEKKRSDAQQKEKSAKNTPKHLQMKQLDGKKYQKKAQMKSVAEDSEEDQMSSHYQPADGLKFSGQMRLMPPSKMQSDKDSSVSELSQPHKLLQSNDDFMTSKKNFTKLSLAAIKDEGNVSEEINQNMAQKSSHSPGQKTPITMEEQKSFVRKEEVKVEEKIILMTPRQIKRLDLIKEIQRTFPPLLQVALDLKDKREKQHRSGELQSVEVVIPNILKSKQSSSVNQPLVSDSFAGSVYSEEQKQQAQYNEKKCTCKATVLVVDDNQYNIMPVEMILKHNYNIDIDVASDGKSSIQMVKKNITKACCNVIYKMIFMDVLMPGINGCQAAAEIQTFLKSHWLKSPEINNSSRHIPIFAMTAFVNKATVEKCRKAGMEGILYKPVSREGLMKQVSIFYNQNGVEPQKVNTSDPNELSSSGPLGSIQSGSTIKNKGGQKNQF